jgi:hypothetical protein
MLIHIFEIFFVIWKYNMIFFNYFWETWPYAWKQNIFFYVLPKTRYFNTGFVFLQYKNTNQYWSKCSRKIRGEITNFLKIFFWIFLGWAGPGPVKKNKQGRTLHYSHATWTVEQPGRGRRRRREVEAYLVVVRSCGSWSCRFYAVGRRFCFSCVPSSTRFCLLFLLFFFCL